ncbi:nucleic acid-binding protein [Suhomyces tanzawaensis NRRL Y-17324]|uniref:Single-stranded DNA-binding protein n=1 Tax=Suhomyces tanzawaensis NRRL Y-17324 TaxID=984487 RepID=A0A1E4SPS4_9ASCO|nr:nucleic acid-binding protein [Suhomyces tanzawaensis NRRL Y-17324]ODV81417.1 nucleic acid-binding protein [Suhomyces tanzawaensis NRRL Y-17324]
MLRQIRTLSSSIVRPSFARVQLLGTVGSVNFKETKDGVKFINYSLAVNRYSPNEEDRTTDWFNVSVFNENQVSAFEKFLKPGVQLFVEADARQRVVADEASESKYTLTSLKQRSFDVVRYAKREETEESQ